jgi:hypothetical protein
MSFEARGHSDHSRVEDLRSDYTTVLQRLLNRFMSCAWHVSRENEALECGVVEKSERDAVKSSLAGSYRGFGVNRTFVISTGEDKGS